MDLPTVKWCPAKRRNNLLGSLQCPAGANKWLPSFKSAFQQLQEFEVFGLSGRGTLVFAYALYRVLQDACRCHLAGDGRAASVQSALLRHGLCSYAAVATARLDGQALTYLNGGDT